MDNIHPRDLPVFFDPALDYLAEHLPDQLYDALFTALSYGLMLASGALSLLATLPSWKPWEWDAQRMLPPLISVLAAYYTLVSLYRTTGWVMRLTFRIVKWSVILSILAASAGWFMGSNNGQGGVFDIIRTALQGQGGNQGADRGTRGRQGTGRPRPWEPFGVHQQWNFDEQEARHAQGGGMFAGTQQVLQYIAGYAGRAMGGAAYDVIGGVQSFLDNVAEAANENADEDEIDRGRAAGRRGATRRQPKRKAKTAAQRRTRSR